MAELQGRKGIGRDFETTIEEFEKRIKLLFQPGKMKVRFEQFGKDAGRKLPSLPSQELLIRVRRNLHLPFLSESLEYMKELYGLPKMCQEALDLALTCPDAEQIIQKTIDPAMKANIYEKLGYLASRSIHTRTLIWQSFLFLLMTFNTYDTI
ncbi:hypothetical protein ACFX1T_009348 [Malus domestica]